MNSSGMIYVRVQHMHSNKVYIIKNFIPNKDTQLKRHMHTNTVPDDIAPSQDLYIYPFGVVVGAVAHSKQKLSPPSMKIRD